MSKTVLITGITGQDGAYLAQFLLTKGYSVVGVTRNINESNLNNLKYLGIKDKVILKKCNLLDLPEVLSILGETTPDEIYNLASQSSVSLSFFQPAETIQFNVLSTLNLLNAIKSVCPATRFYQASSSEMYGNVDKLPINEQSLLRPVSPYAISKASAHLAVINYRETYNLYLCCGILFNHISNLSSDNFFIKKVVNSAINIKKGIQQELRVGNLNVKRDFGYAPDYVKVMWQMLQQDSAQDFIIASGSSVYLSDIVYYVFDKLDVDRKKIIIDQNLFRPNEILDIWGDKTKAERVLGWKYDKNVFDVLDLVIEERLLDEKKDKCII